VILQATPARSCSGFGAGGRGAFEPQTRSQAIAHTAVLKGFNDMVTLRQQRLAGVDASIPGALWYTVAVGGLITPFLGLMVFIIYAQDRPLRNEIGASSARFVATHEMMMRWDDRP
jgi:hypothetical protein